MAAIYAGDALRSVIFELKYFVITIYKSSVFAVPAFYGWMTDGTYLVGKWLNISVTIGVSHNSSKVESSQHPPGINKRENSFKNRLKFIFSDQNVLLEVLNNKNLHMPKIYKKIDQNRLVLSVLSFDNSTAFCAAKRG